MSYMIFNLCEFDLRNISTHVIKDTDVLQGLQDKANNEVS